MNIDDILSYQKPKSSYYDILGCSQSSSVEQITREYKIRALQLHPDKNPNPESAEEFKQLQLAKEVLTNVESRKSYDIWLNSGINIPFDQFKNKRGHSMHWAPPRQTKLSILENDKNAKSSGSKFDHDVGKGHKTSNVLEKFRKYEV